MSTKMLVYMTMAIVCRVIRATVIFHQNKFHISGGYTFVNVFRHFEDMSIVECAAECSKFAKVGSCEMAGYNLTSRTCDVSLDTQTMASLDDNVLVLQFFVNCSMPAAPEHGLVQLSNDRQIATFSCNSGYILNGTGTVQCINGAWGGNLPSCYEEPGCGSNPPMPVNGDHYSSITGNACNDTATLVCRAGFVPSVPSITCQNDGQWEPVSCIFDCGQTIETDYANVKASYPFGTIEGTMATGTCGLGYRSDSGTSSWSFLCDAGLERWTTAQDPDCVWELMFRGTAENGYNVTNAFLFGDVTDGVTSEQGCVDVYNTSCSLHYRNAKVDQWGTLPIDEVSYELYDTTSVVLEVIFSGTGSTMNSWFSTSAVLNHPWSIDDLSATWWDLNSSGDIGYGRSFRMTSGYEKEAVYCADHYYTVAFYPPGYGCSYEVFPAYPAFTYSTNPQGSVYNTAVFQTARAMGIWVKYL